VRRFIFLLIPSLLCLWQAIAQSPNGTINGIVLDPSGGTIVGAQVIVVNDATGIQYATKTNGEGIYAVSNLPPGSYRVQVSNSGFKTIIKPYIVIHVQDALAINFTLPIGSASEVVTVGGGAPLINTESASVATIVDRKYVENMPLNGRSFQDLILLVPGVVTNSPQSASSNGNFGEFSVNGQRTESNYYTVDGVSANVGIAAAQALSAGNSGSLPASTALGTTQGLVSVDALEEFRVQSSSYSAEYGRNPGGQFSLVTRSGTSDWHGSAFDYFRNNVFDANGWFNDFLKRPQPPLRQNDFGGTLGGPIQIPYIYKGTDRTFFFFSYEGLRLLQPQAAEILYVPTAALRISVPSVLKPVLSAFPLPNCPASAANCSNDLGDGLGNFIGVWSNPNSLDSYSVRLDHSVNPRLKLFFRFGGTRSSTSNRTLSTVVSNSVEAHTYTLGATSQLSSHMDNELRLNYSSTTNQGSFRIDNFGGAQPVNLAQIQGVGGSYAINFFIGFDNTSQISSLTQESGVEGLQRQWNVVDTLGWSLGRHRVRLGVDYRRLAPIQRFPHPTVFYEYLSAASLQANRADFAFAQAQAPAYPNFDNFSAFVQDEYQVTARWHISLGLRWDVNPAPGAAKGNLPYTLEGSINNPASLALAPQGTALWRTSWYNFAPRLGVAHVLRNAPGFETVVRAGGGVFFDTAQQDGTFGYNGVGFSASVFPSPATFPLPASQVVPTISNPPIPPYNLIYAFPSHLQLPFTLQWNASVQQAIGKSQALTLSYVAANGRRLLESNQFSFASQNPNLGTVIYKRNGLTSDYDALEVQYQRRMSRGLQALASYTWSHCIDYGSQDTSSPYLRGNCDFDVRQNFASAFSYDLPDVEGNRVARTLLHNWGLDDRFSARTGFPVTLNGATRVNPATLQSFFAGLDLVPGQPLYVYGSQYPGGRSINPAAFSNPPPGGSGDAPRNFLRGFGAWQMDLALRREFPIHENLRLQFRAEAFNIFNHPNFGQINSSLCAPGPFCQFGQATGTLATSLGVLSPLYQMGGPRSLQFALKLTF
jgi:hypothetical protein